MAADPGGSGGRAHGPAGADPPSGFGEATWWPVVVVAGAVAIYAGVGAVVIAPGVGGAVGSLLGVGLGLAGLVAFVAGLAGWNYHGFVVRYGTGPAGGLAERYRWGMGLFLCSEVATFGAGFGYYAYVRAGSWPPGHLPHLLSSLVAVNTALLVASSLTLHLAHGALRAGRRRRFVGLLAATVALGVVFLAGQVWEYYRFLAVEGFTVSQGAFASAFYGLTGLHGLHVGLGVVVLSIVLVRAWIGQYSPTRHTSVTTATMYWHFVDGVWLLLVAGLYVGATVTV